MQLAQKVHKSMMGMFVALILMLSFAPIAAFANTAVVKQPPITTAGIGGLCTAMTEMTKSDTNAFKVDLKADAKGQSPASEVFKCNSASGLEFDKQAFDNGTEKSRKKVMQNLVTSLKESKMEDQHQQYVIDKLSSRDSDVSRMLIPIVMDSTSADLYTALKWLSPLLPIVRVLFGIGAIVISILLIGSTIIDLCFIGLPIMRESMNNNADSRGGKIPFVSSDAVSVIKETESSSDSSGGYKNAYLVYFKRRAITYIILSICLLYLVLGELSGLIAWLLSLGDGIVGGS